MYWYTSGYLGSGIFSKSEILIHHDDFEIRLSKPITFRKDQIETSLSKEINNAITNLADHLIEFPKLKLLITGLYTLDEERSSAETNLGYLRALEFKNLLVSHGADPGNLFTSSRLSQFSSSGQKRFKGIELAVMDESKKLNTNPLLDDSESEVVRTTTLILPYFTSEFENLDLLNDEIAFYLERCIQSPDLALYIQIYQSDNQQIKKKSLDLLNRLKEYLQNQVEGLEIPVLTEEEKQKALSDMDEQNIKIDIGIKRFPNNLEFLGS